MTDDLTTFHGSRRFLLRDVKTEPDDIRGVARKLIGRCITVAGEDEARVWAADLVDMLGVRDGG